MKAKIGIGLVVGIGLISILACSVGGTPTATPVPPTVVPPTVAPPTVPPPTDTPAPVITDTPTPAPTGPCVFVLTGEATAYSRPSLEADVFGTVTPDLPIEPGAKTADGWIGFDPGVAQAANVGPFRLRWVQPSDTVALSGDCSSLPVVAGPPVGVCFEMFMEIVDVRAAPDAASALVTGAQPGDYVAVIGQAGDWLQVDLSVGNLGIDQLGWIPVEAANFNGPCDALPTVTP